MKIVYIVILSFLQVLVFGQANSIVEHIFYDLPLNKSRKEIQKVIKSDPRFKETRDDKEEGLFIAMMSPYLGACLDQGVVESQADSVEIELTFGYESLPEKGKNKSKNLTFLKIRYFYSSLDSVEREYQRIINLLRPILKDTSLTGVDTIYSSSPIRSQFKAKGMEFKNQKPYYRIKILNASITKSYFGLFIEYECEEIKDDK